MLDVSLAEKLIERVTRYTSYNVNIMDEKGIIIASRNPERIGTFHEAAWQALHGPKDIVTVQEDTDYPGALRGINMVIDIDGKREGVVGVTGNPEEIRPVALITKMAIETMIKYENQKFQSIRRQSKKERFLEILTQEENGDPEYIRRLARELDYREEIVRIPILCCLEQPDRSDSLLSMIKQSIGHSSQDISFLLDTRYVLIFKSMDVPISRLFSDYKYILAEYLSSTLRWLKRESLTCRFYIGSFQNSFTQYYYGYRHCRWLEDHIRSEHTALYFYDYTGVYIQELIPKKELQQIFNVFGSRLSDDFKNNYKELIGALIDTDFNILQASQKSFMHKNTFTYRYNKIRDMLNADPQRTAKDKWLIICLYLYLQH